jgi:hypothetical protein
MFVLIAAALPLLYFARTFFYDIVNTERMRNLSLKLAWHSMNAYSTLEIYGSKLNQQVKHYMPFLYKDDTHNHKIIFVHNGDEIATCTLAELRLAEHKLAEHKLAEHKLAEPKQANADNTLFVEPPNYDFILYESVYGNTMQTNDTCLFRYSNTADILKIEYLATTDDVSLLALRINLNNPTQELQIKFNGRHIYMNGNVLFDRVFINWILNTKYNIKLSDDEKYTVSFLDTSANYVVLTDSEYIRIKKGGYDVLKTAKAEHANAEHAKVEHAKAD